MTQDMEDHLSRLIDTAKNDCRNIEWTDNSWADGLLFTHALDGEQSPFAAVYWNPAARRWDVYEACDTLNETLLHGQCTEFQAINAVRALQNLIFGDAYGKPVIEVSEGYSRREYGHCWRLPAP
jgi:hypothetical protein